MEESVLTRCARGYYRVLEQYYLACAACAAVCAKNDPLDSHDVEHSRVLIAYGGQICRGLSGIFDSANGAETELQDMPEPFGLLETMDEDGVRNWLAGKICGMVEADGR